MAELQLESDSADTKRWLWIIAAWLLVIASGFVLRHSTAVLEKDNIRDEYLMKVPIDVIVQEGWSVETAIDYQELKGPAFFWPYALAGQWFGNEITTMRLVSLCFYALGALPILLIAARCGLRTWGLLSTALFWVLLPYNATQGQLLMSEASFVCGCAWMYWAFVWGVGDVDRRPHHVAGPILVAVFACVLLHHRPHAAAPIGAIGMVSLLTLGLGCWRWWLACALALIGRLPLWMRWGGLVSSDYQELFAFGFDLAGITYIVAATVPFLVIFLVAWWLQARDRRGWIWLGLGGTAGLLLSVIFRPDLAADITYVLPRTGETMSQPEYLGVIATMIRMLPSSTLVELVMFAVLGGIGGAALTALGLLAMQRTHETSPATRTIVTSLGFWTLAGGLPLYALTAGPIYDRYLQVWVVLLPVIWMLWCRRWMLVGLTIVYAGMLMYFIRQNLV